MGHTGLRAKLPVHNVTVPCPSADPRSVRLSQLDGPGGQPPAIMATQSPLSHWHRLGEVRHRRELLTTGLSKMEDCISSMSYLTRYPLSQLFDTFQGFRVGRDGMPWASAPEDRTAPNDGITKHPNPPWLPSRCRESNGLPSGPAWCQQRPPSDSHARPSLAMSNPAESRPISTNLHSSSDVLAMAPVACQPHTLEHAWTMAGSWAIGNNQQPCMPEGQNGGLLKANVDAQVLYRSDQKIATTNPTHSSTRCSSWGCIALSSTPRTGWWGWFVCVLGSVSKTRATSRAVCWFSRQRGC